MPIQCIDLNLPRGGPVSAVDSSNHMLTESVEGIYPLLYPLEL